MSGGMRGVLTGMVCSIRLEKNCYFSFLQMRPQCATLGSRRGISASRSSSTRNPRGGTA